MNACFCTGPRPGHTLCPCRERAEAEDSNEAFLRGVEVGRRLSDKRDVGVDRFIEMARRRLSGQSRRARSREFPDDFKPMFRDY